MGSVENFRKVADIVNGVEEEKIVVLSAMSGVTNTLVEISEQLSRGARDEALAGIAGLDQKYRTVASELLADSSFQNKPLPSWMTAMKH